VTRQVARPSEHSESNQQTALILRGYPRIERRPRCCAAPARDRPWRRARHPGSSPIWVIPSSLPKPVGIRHQEANARHRERYRLPCRCDFPRSPNSLLHGAPSIPKYSFGVCSEASGCNGESQPGRLRDPGFHLLIVVFRACRTSLGATSSRLALIYHEQCRVARCWSSSTTTTCRVG